MVAQLAPERQFRGPGCTEACEVVRAIVPGRFGRSELLLHDPASHEEYGFALGVGGATGTVQAGIVVSGPLVVDFRRVEVSVDGRPIRLTRTETEILFCVAKHRGAAVSFETIVEEVWRDDAWGYGPHQVRVNVSRLRWKLGRAASLFATVFAFGYRLEMIAQGADLAPFVPHGYVQRRADRWARDWDRCRACRRTDRPHNGRGYCTACHQKAARSAGDSQSRREHDDRPCQNR